jgi:hypothetical protein
MKRVLTVSAMIVLCLGSVTVAAAQIPCVLGNNAPFPGTTMALGPLMHFYTYFYPEDGSAAVNGLNAWNGGTARRPRAGSWATRH